MVRVRMLGAAVLAAGLLLGTTGCSSFAGSDAASATGPHTSTSSSTSSSNSSSETTTSAATTDAASTTPGGPLDSDAAGRKLTLADFFQPQSYWQEKRYDIADQKDVQGIATTVAACGDSNPRELELRLANNFDQLTFSAAQANDSQRSDQDLVVEVLANNEQVEIRSIPFNQVQQFTIDVSGVNALKIRLYLDDSNQHCSGSVVGVVTDVEVS